MGSINAPSFDIVATRLRRGGQSQTDDELPEPDHNNAETGSRSSSDQSELPWFDSEEANTLGALEKNSCVENDYTEPSFSGGSKGAQNGLESSPKIVPSPLNDTRPGVVPSPTMIPLTEGRKIVVTNSTSEFGTDNDNDSWFSEEISADDDMTLGEALEVQRERSPPVDARVASDGTGVELHMNLPKIYRVHLLAIYGYKLRWETYHFNFLESGVFSQQEGLGTRAEFTKRSVNISFTCRRLVSCV